MNKLFSFIRATDSGFEKVSWWVGPHNEKFCDKVPYRPSVEEKNEIKKKGEIYV